MKSKIILIGIGAAAGIFGISKIFSLKSWYDALNVSFKGKISGLKGTTAILKCQAILDNPKNFKVSISKPTIRIYNGTTQIAYSQPTSDKITIQPNAVTIIDYEIEVPLLSGGLYKMLLNAGKNVIKIIAGYVKGTQAELTLGVKLEVLYYMTMYGISKKWKEKIEI